MNNVAMIELETQQRGQAFSRARKQLEIKYNCTVTIVPRWEPGVSKTFVLSFDEQVLVGPTPAPIEPEGEAKTDEEI